LNSSNGSSRASNLGNSSSRSFISNTAAQPIPQSRYEVFDRNTRVQVELFRQENVALETEQAKKGQEYQKLCGAMTVQFRGEEETLAQMARYLEEPDRALRQEAWELVARRRLRDAEKTEEIFDALLALREAIAGNAGFKNYLEYAFRARGRFDYSQPIASDSTRLWKRKSCRCFGTCRGNGGAN
jgi:oligoendopeptidase F